MDQSRSDSPPDQQVKDDVVVEVRKSTQEVKSGKGKYKGENDLIDLENNETKISNTENGKSDLSTRHTDSNLARAESGLRGNDEGV